MNYDWFTKLSQQFPVDHELVELASVKDGTLSQLALWNRDVSAPFLAWVAACNCAGSIHQQYLIDQTSLLINQMMGEFKFEKVTRDLSRSDLRAELQQGSDLGLRAIFLVHVGRAIEALTLATWQLNPETVPADPDRARKVPSQIAKATEHCEYFCSIGYKIREEDAPINFFYLLESKVRTYLDFKKGTGICPKSMMHK